MTDRASSERSPRERPPADHFGLLLTLLVASFLLSVMTDHDVLRVTGTLINGLALVVTYRSTANHQTDARIAAVMTLAIVAVVAESVTRNDDIPGGGSAMLQVLILAVMMAAVLRRLFAHEHVGMQTILAGFSVYFLIGLTFGWSYAAIEAFQDGPTFVTDGTADPIYYSFVVLTTVGFGDITPANDLVARITVLQAVVGQLFLATLIARLVSMYGTQRSG